MRFVMPEVVRVRLVEGGSEAGFGKSGEGAKDPSIVKADTRAERNNGARARSFMWVGKWGWV